MIRNTTKRQKLGWVLFILYLCLLAYFMFFSESFGRTDTDRGYAYNLVPFKEILRFIRYRGIRGEHQRAHSRKRLYADQAFGHHPGGRG